MGQRAAVSSITDMKILALAHERADVVWRQFAAELKEEAAAVWRLHCQGTIREIYFTGDTREAVLMLECANTEDARDTLADLPLVRRGLMQFEVRPLVPYDGFERLFSTGSVGGGDEVSG
jgi:hypothetical protein